MKKEKNEQSTHCQSTHCQSRNCHFKCLSQEFTFKKLIYTALILPLITSCMILCVPVYKFFLLRSPEKDLKIVSKSYSCKDKKEGSRVTIIGMLKNQSDEKYGNIYFNVSLLGADSKLVGSDTINQKKLYIPSKTKASFSIAYTGNKACQNYDSIELRVVNSDVH